VEIERIYERWHEYARTGDVERLLLLYADDAIFESPLVPVLTDGGLRYCRGHTELRRFLEEGVRRRPNELVRWYRTGEFLSNGRMLMWEYPRRTPEGEQIDICEVMEVEDGKIQVHRIYWGWLGCALLAGSRRAQEAFERIAA
jgi:hypothetical protein